ncbi:MAG: hypothetical protein LBU67_10330 [Oscillospiraceae bacterium]|jgi:hypothetical protein|nr:hypothetical protein [Oscillospiraceae bacterium]
MLIERKQIKKAPPPYSLAVAALFWMKRLAMERGWRRVKRVFYPFGSISRRPGGAALSGESASIRKDARYNRKKRG